MAQSAPNIVGAFGVRRAWIATPAAPPVWNEIPDIVSATYKQTVAEVEQTGNDTVIDMWYYGQKGSVAVKASRSALTILSQLQGNNNTSTTSYNYISFGVSSELIPPMVAFRGFIVGKDDSFNKVHVLLYLYRTTVKTTMEAYPDAAYGKLSEITLTFTAFKSATDETNAALASNANAIGRIEYWVASVSPVSGWE